MVRVIVFVDIIICRLVNHIGIFVSTLIIVPIIYKTETIVTVILIKLYTYAATRGLNRILFSQFNANNHHLYNTAPADK